MAAGDSSDKTEKPTPKRLREAREKGQIAKTPDLSTWVAMLATTVLLQITFQRGATVLPDMLHEMGLVIAHPDLGAASRFAADAMWQDRRGRRADAPRHDDHRAARERRAGRVQTDVEEAQARLQPAQPLQGHQEDGRHADVVGARQGARQDRAARRGRVAGVHARDARASRRATCRTRSRSPGFTAKTALTRAAQRVGRRSRRRGRRLRVPEAPGHEAAAHDAPGTARGDEAARRKPGDAAVDPVARDGDQPQPDDPGRERGRRRGREPDPLRGRAEVRRGQGRAPGGRQGGRRDRGRRSGPRPSATGSRSSTSRSSPGPSTRRARSASSSRRTSTRPSPTCSPSSSASGPRAGPRATTSCRNRSCSEPTPAI